MTIARFHFDDDSADWRVLRALRAVGFNVTAPWDVGLYGALDDQHLAFAAAEARVMVTGNIGDFMQLHSSLLAAGTGHAGVIFVIQNKYSAGERIRRIRKLADTLDASEMANRYEFLSDWD